MFYLQYLNLSDRHYDVMNMDTGALKPSVSGVICAKGSKYAYYSRLDKYDLQLDLARKLRSRWYRYDRDKETVEEMFVNWDCSAFQITQFWPMADGRFFIVASCTNGPVRGYSVTWDGSDVALLWETSGYPYSFEKSPSGDKFAYHLAGGEPPFNPLGRYYAINTMQMDGTRQYVYHDDGFVCFGPIWSPDEQWLVFQKLNRTYLGEQFADIAICRTDGSDYRQLTTDKPQYNDTSAGLPGHRTGGTNRPIWTPESKLIYSKRLPDAHSDARFDETQRNHEEWIYDPSMERGGCGLCLMDPFIGTETMLTDAVEGRWDFRPSLSPDGKILAFTRVVSGEAPAIYLMNRGTGEITFLTKGEDDLGADYPWFTEGTFVDVD